MADADDDAALTDDDDAATAATDEKKPAKQPEDEQHREDQDRGLVRPAPAVLLLRGERGVAGKRIEESEQCSHHRVTSESGTALYVPPL